MYIIIDISKPKCSHVGIFIFAVYTEEDEWKEIYIFLCILCIVEYLPPSGRKATQCSPLRKILSDGCTFFLSMYVYVSMHARSLLPKVLSSNLCSHTCSRSVTQSDILSRPPGPLGAFHPSFAADCLLNQMKAMQNVTECKVRYMVSGDIDR